MHKFKTSGPLVFGPASNGLEENRQTGKTECDRIPQGNVVLEERVERNDCSLKEKLKTAVGGNLKQSVEFATTPDQPLKDAAKGERDADNATKSPEEIAGSKSRRKVQEKALRIIETLPEEEDNLASDCYEENDKVVNNKRKFAQNMIKIDSMNRSCCIRCGVEVITAFASVSEHLRTCRAIIPKDVMQIKNFDPKWTLKTHSFEYQEYMKMDGDDIKYCFCNYCNARIRRGRTYCRDHIVERCHKASSEVKKMFEKMPKNLEITRLYFGTDLKPLLPKNDISSESLRKLNEEKVPNETAKASENITNCGKFQNTPKITSGTILSNSCDNIPRVSCEMPLPSKSCKENIDWARFFRGPDENGMVECKKCIKSFKMTINHARFCHRHTSICTAITEDEAIYIQNFFPDWFPRSRRSFELSDYLHDEIIGGKYSICKLCEKRIVRTRALIRIHILSHCDVASAEDKQSLTSDDFLKIDWIDRMQENAANATVETSEPMETKEPKVTLSKKRPLVESQLSISSSHGILLPETVKENFEICKACNGLDHNLNCDNWNLKWIACMKCGDSYHRSCVDNPVGSTPFGPVCLPDIMDPTKLSAETMWTCSGCLECDKCEQKTVMDVCYVCNSMNCSSCVPQKKARLPTNLWSGPFHVCRSCTPTCISCSTILSEQRSAESRWCRRCYINHMNGRTCPGCLKAYSDLDDDDGPMIQCDKCHIWVHYGCTGLTDKQLKGFEKSETESYTCKKCDKPKECSASNCHACIKTGNGSIIGSIVPLNSWPTKWSHEQCRPLSEYLIAQHPEESANISSKSVLASESMSLSADASQIIVKHWDQEHVNTEGVPMARSEWKLSLSSDKSLCLTSHDTSIDGSSLEDLMENLSKKLSEKKNSRVEIITGLLGKLSLAHGKLMNLKEELEAVRPPKRTWKKSKKTASAAGNEVVKPVEIFFDLSAVPDDGACARTRHYQKGLYKNRASSSPAQPEDDYPDSLKLDQIPLRISKSGKYRSASLTSAYRSLGNPISTGDLIVSPSGIAGYGLYTGRSYVCNELIIEYQGEVIGQAVADHREAKHPLYQNTCYMFRLDETRIIDATLVGNAARFINHACQPNCRTKHVIVEGQPRILVFAKRSIKKGEELSYDYQFALDEDGKGKLPCYCGAVKCRGWMN